VSSSTRSRRPIASVSLDLDNLWSYMKIHGDSDWEKRPTYFPRFIPMVLDILNELGLTITVFVVGAYSAYARNRRFLRMISDAGHEIGNHSYEHESWMHLYSRERIEAEIRQAEDAISDSTGQCPRGFRGPGFSWSRDLLEVLAERKYLYDASTLPTWIGPVSRWYYFRTANLDKNEREQRAGLFGSFHDVTRPNRPYYWSDLASRNDLLEIPVTTVPVVRTPFHLSYLLYLSGISEWLMLAYLRFALNLCLLTRTPPSFLLHPLDLLSGQDAPELAFFPGMDLPARTKRSRFVCALREITRNYNVVPMAVQANGK